MHNKQLAVYTNKGRYRIHKQSQAKVIHRGSQQMGEDGNTADQGADGWTGCKVGIQGKQESGRKVQAGIRIRIQGGKSRQGSGARIRIKVQKSGSGYRLRSRRYDDTRARSDYTRRVFIEAC